MGQRLLRYLRKLTQKRLFLVCVSYFMWLFSCPSCFSMQDDLNLRYVRLWCTPTTRAQIYLNSNGVTSLAVETIFSGLNVTEEAAKQVVFAKFRFPTKSDSEKFTIDNFAGYAKRDIATWHFKAKGMLFASYLDGLVSHKEYGHFVQRGRHRVPVLPRHQARALLEDNTFITSTTSYSALVAAIIDFISSVPEASCLLVACSQTVSEAFLRLLNAQFSWFTLKVRCVLAHAFWLACVLWCGQTWSCIKTGTDVFFVVVLGSYFFDDCHPCTFYSSDPNGAHHFGWASQTIQLGHKR